MIDYKKTFINNIDDWIVFEKTHFINIINNPTQEPELFQAFIFYENHDGSNYYTNNHYLLNEGIKEGIELESYARLLSIDECLMYIMKP